MERRNMRWACAWILCAVCGMSTAASVSAESGRWKEVRKAEGRVLSVDLDSLSRSPEGLVRAWVRVENREKPLLDLGKFARKLDKRATGEEHSKSRWEIDCGKGLFRILESLSYDRYGEVISSTGCDEKALWKSVPPESDEEAVSRAVCGGRGR